MKIKKQFIITMLLFSATFILILAFMIINNRLLIKANRQLEVAENIALWAGDIGFLSAEYLIYREQQQLNRLQNKYKAVTEEVIRLAAGNTVAIPWIARIGQSHLNLKDAFTQLILSPENVAAANKQGFDPVYFKTTWDKLASQSKGLASDASLLARHLRQKIDTIHQSLDSLVYIIIVWFIALFFAAYPQANRYIPAKINKPRDKIKIPGVPSLTSIITGKKKNKTGALSRFFNRMTANLTLVTDTNTESENGSRESKSAATDFWTNEKRYRDLFMSINEEVHYWRLIRDNEGHINTCKLIDINPPALKTWGRDYAEVKGKSYEDIFGREATRHFLPQVREAVLTGTSYSYEEYTPESARYSRFTIVPLQNHLIITGADITESKKAQAELHKLNRTLRALSESNQAMLHAENEPAYLWEVCHIIVATCGYLMAWIGYTDDEEIKAIKPMAQSGRGKEYVEKLNISWAEPGCDQNPAGMAIRTAKTALCRDMHTNAEHESWQEESLKYGFTSMIALPLSAAGKVFGSLNIYSKDPDPFSEDEIKLLEELAKDLAYGIIMLRIRIQNREAEMVLRRDNETLEKLVAERSRELLNAQAELERARRLSDIGTLAATVAHELRNPLAAIALAAYNIKKKAKFPAIDKHLDTIEKKVDESDQIINNLLFYSRLGPPCLEKINASVILEECIATIGQKRKKEVHITREPVTRESMILEADSIQIKEVLNNILNNALDAAPHEGGEIRISIYCDASSISITIRDNGPGIDQSIKDRIFDPFFTTKAKGTGLGLSVCRQIITMHHGSIKVESEPGKGTAVSVVLPRKERKNNSSHQTAIPPRLV